MPLRDYCQIDGVENVDMQVASPVGTFFQDCSGAAIGLGPSDAQSLRVGTRSCACYRFFFMWPASAA